MPSGYVIYAQNIPFADTRGVRPCTHVIMQRMMRVVTYQRGISLVARSTISGNARAFRRGTSDEKVPTSFFMPVANHNPLA